MSLSSARPSSSRTLLIANPSADLYGSDRMLLEAVRGLVSLGWRAVVTCSTDGPLVQRLRSAGAEVVILRAPVVRKSILSARGMTALVRDVFAQLPGMIRLIRRLQPAAVLVNTVTLPLCASAAVVAA